MVELHGSVERAAEVVFTREDYRRRLHGSPGYATFLRSVMATTTVLYLGFSFTDAYLDELRSEVLALLEYTGGDVPIAYALLSDVTDDEVVYARAHEGIEVVRYSSDNSYAEFDARLEAIYEATNPMLRLGQVLDGSRIVWIDPAPATVDFGLDFLKDAAHLGDGTAEIIQFRDSSQALDHIEQHGADLVVTHWGHGRGPAGMATGEHVLSEVRRRDVRSPALVFASGDHADENKRMAMSLGATGFELSWEGLFREIERIFTPGSLAR